MIGIDIFAGAGGLSMGAQLAGIKLKMAVEIDYYSAETFIHNHRDVVVINDDIRNIKSLDINSNGEDLIIFGGPPCQGFSWSNQRTRNKNNPKNWLFKEYFRLIKQIKPDWILLENVKGILNTENGFFIKKIINNFNKLGYNSKIGVLNSADYGVPQKRERVFIVGSLKGIKFKFPAPKGEKYITVKEAIADLPKLENGDKIDELPFRFSPISKFAKQMRRDSNTSKNNLVTENSDLILERYKYVPQGGNWTNIPKELMFNYKDLSRCHTGIYYRLIDCEPSIVITNYRKNMLIHPNKNRGLSVREAARLQSFPDTFIFKGSIGFQQQQVGDAVPPLLAKEVFLKILEYS